MGQKGSRQGGTSRVGWPMSETHIESTVTEDNRAETKCWTTWSVIPINHGHLLYNQSVEWLPGQAQWLVYPSTPRTSVHGPTYSRAQWQLDRWKELEEMCGSKHTYTSDNTAVETQTLSQEKQKLKETHHHPYLSHHQPDPRRTIILL